MVSASTPVVACGLDGGVHPGQASCDTLPGALRHLTALGLRIAGKLEAEEGAIFQAEATEAFPEACPGFGSIDCHREVLGGDVGPVGPVS